MLMRLALLMRLLEASESEVGKKLHGSMPANTIRAYGAVPSEGSLTSLPNMTVENHHGEKRPDERPGGADHGLLVAHRNVAPGQDRKKLASPKVLPIMPLGTAAGLDDQLVGVRRARSGGNLHVAGGRGSCPSKIPSVRST